MLQDLVYQYIWLVRSVTVSSQLEVTIATNRRSLTCSLNLTYVVSVCHERASSISFQCVMSFLWVKESSSCAEFMKHYVMRHMVLTSTLDEGEWPTSRPGKRALRAYCIGCRVGPRCSLVSLENGKVCFPCRRSKPGNPARSPTLMLTELSLLWLQAMRQQIVITCVCCYLYC